MIPKNVVYRIYNDELAIVMNVANNRVLILQNEALRLWQQITAQRDLPVQVMHGPIFNQLADFRMIDVDHDFYQSDDNEMTASQNIEEVGLHIVNYWAFKNHAPLSGHFELTGRCNLRCRHCYCLFREKQDTLPTNKIISILDDLARNGTLGIVLTGGEIFFRDDIIEILAHLSEKKFVVRLNTNGSLIDEHIVEKMTSFANIYRIHVSLYGPDAEIHDGITRRPGSFDRTIKALNLLKEAKFNLRINCSIMKSNIEKYKAIKTEIGDKLGIPVHYDSTIYPKDDGSTHNLVEQIDDEQFEGFWQFKSQSVENENKESGKKNKLCKAGFSFFSITEDGSLFPCLKMKRYYRNPLGNLQKESFQTIWQGSDKILSIRQSLQDKLRHCNICDMTI